MTLVCEVSKDQLAMVETLLSEKHNGWLHCFRIVWGHVCSSGAPGAQQPSQNKVSNNHCHSLTVISLRISWWASMTRRTTRKAEVARGTIPNILGRDRLKLMGFILLACSNTGRPSMPPKARTFCTAIRPRISSPGHSLDRTLKQHSIRLRTPWTCCDVTI